LDLQGQYRFKNITKICTDLLPLQRPHTVTKMNNKIILESNGTIKVDAYFVPRVPQEKLLKCWITNIYKKVKATEDS
jgi:hypothetical protein